jgi:hypothetical protein
MPDYVLGDQPPMLTPDKGSGPWCAAPQTFEYAAYKRAISVAMGLQQVELKVGPQAIAHMRHYLGNTGQDLKVDMGALMAKSHKLRALHDAELLAARRFAETLQPGLHAITSSKTSGGYFRLSDEPHLFYAIGGYVYWGQGRVNVTTEASLRRYRLDFEFHFFDRYNWDKGKTTPLTDTFKIKDDLLQELHKRCYAREYDVRGVSRQQVAWEVLVGPPQPRQRNPFDVLTQ